MLGDDFLDEFAVDVGEAHVAAAEAVSELGVIDPHQVHHRGVQVVHGALVFDRLIAVFVGCPGDDAPLHAAARHPEAETERVVISAV